MYKKLKNKLMKRSILTTGLIVSSILYANAVTANTENTEVVLNDNDAKTENRTRQVYQWVIETEHGVFTGTCMSIAHVNKEITMLTDHTKVLKKNIIPVALINDDLENKVYTWTIVTNKDRTARNLEEETREIRLFETIEHLKSAMIDPYTTLK